MLNSKSYDSVVQAKRRNDALNAFGVFWQQGNSNKRMKAAHFLESSKSGQIPKRRKTRTFEEQQSLLEQLHKD